MMHITIKEFLDIVFRLEGAISVEYENEYSDSFVSVKIEYSNGVVNCEFDIIGETLYVSKISYCGNKPSIKSIEGAISSICKSIASFDITCVHVSSKCFDLIYEVLEKLEFIKIYSEVPSYIRSYNKFEYYRKFVRHNVLTTLPEIKWRESND